MAPCSRRTQIRNDTEKPEIVLFAAAGVAIQHRLQPCAIVALLRRPQHVGPPEDVSLQHSGAQDGSRAPAGYVQLPKRSVAALRSASHQHLTTLFLPATPGD